MSITYTIVYSHGNDSAGMMRREFATDGVAVDFTRAFVRDGFRDQTEATVCLTDGRKYQCINRHGGSDACYDGVMLGDELPVAG